MKSGHHRPQQIAVPSSVALDKPKQNSTQLKSLIEDRMLYWDRQNDS